MFEINSICIENVQQSKRVLLPVIDEKVVLAIV